MYCLEDAIVLKFNPLGYKTQEGNHWIKMQLTYPFHQHLPFLLEHLGILFLLLVQLGPFSPEDQLSLLVLEYLRFDQRLKRQII